MARLRNAPADKPFAVTRLSTRAFVEKLNTHGGLAGTGDMQRNAPFWTGFAFAPPGLDVASAQRSLIDESVSGFYDSDTDEVFVRRGDFHTETERLAVAHEIAHAVQHRIGLGTAFDGSVDAAIARQALVEGDANVVAAAYLAQRSGRQPGIAVARLRDRLRTMATPALAKAVHTSEALAGAPALLRERMTFPYVEGTSLAAALYQSGGIPLMNAALARPPASTEQVLHPEKYIAGELPLPIATPNVERGEVVDHGTLGELQTGIYLAQCLDASAARKAAEGWGGDSYVIVRSETGALSVVWNTAWDTEDAAIRFEAALRARAHCGSAAHAPRVTRRAANVLVVDTTEDVLLPLDKLLAPAPSRPPATPPLGNVNLRTIPPPEPQLLHRGSIRSRVFSSEALGMTFPIETDFAASVPRDGAELELRRTGTYGRYSSAALLGRIYFQFEPFTSDLEAETTERLTRSIAGASHGNPPHESYGMRLRSGLADVDEFPFDEGGLKIAFVPACGGEATLVLAGYWSGPSGDLTTDQWFDRVLLDEDAPACRYLKTLATLTTALAVSATPPSP